jgi:type IV secretory pathway VirJ component
MIAGTQPCVAQPCLAAPITQPSGSLPRRRCPLWRRLGIAVALVLALLAAFAGYLGYFGGPVLTVIPAGSPTRGQPQAAAVVLSGDMGFNIGMAPQIARRLAARGIPVVGINSLTFFRSRRTPGEVTDLLDAASRKALALRPGGRVILVGQSFGADMLHLGVGGLAPELKRRVQLVALVVPTDTLLLRASPSELFDWWTPRAAARPSAARLVWAPALCIYGRDEHDSLCPLLRQPNLRKVELPGGHPLHHDADAVFAALWRAITRTAPTGDAAGLIPFR